MSKFNKVISEAHKYLDSSKSTRKTLFVLLIIFSITLSITGVAFGIYVFKMVGQLNEAAITLAKISHQIVNTSENINAQSIASTVGDNTMWVPIIGGLSLVLLAIIYLFRIYTLRVIWYEDEILSLEKLRVLEGEGDLSVKLEDALIYSAIGKVNKKLPNLIPSVEIAEKSISSIANILSKNKNSQA